jgi:hypothetical protein
MLAGLARDFCAPNPLDSQTGFAHQLSDGAESVLAKQRLHSATDFITDSSDFLHGQTLRVAERPVITTKTWHIGTFVATAHCDERLGITRQCFC